MDMCYHGPAATGLMSLSRSARDDAAVPPEDMVKWPRSKVSEMSFNVARLVMLNVTRLVIH